MVAIRGEELPHAGTKKWHRQKWQKMIEGSHFCHSWRENRATKLVSVRVSRIGRHSTSKELIMIAFLFLLTATAAVLAVYTAIGRLAIPAEERVPWRDLGWDGWRQTLRRSLVFLGGAAPRGGARTC